MWALGCRFKNRVDTFFLLVADTVAVEFVPLVCLQIESAGIQLCFASADCTSQQLGAQVAEWVEELVRSLSVARAVIFCKHFSMPALRHSDCCVSAPQQPPYSHGWPLSRSH
uniref:Uncharacterized protein n=1 Tax=Noctiluca scintillans TaxID=2966 RepID=A0A7S1ALY5_NOCSC|mmetsp:Transcript_51784/g.138182  ORF Transcript_51784/g.138182 Transcript_51784/m.138182 type:complete len:112 (+) Transcript_51784:566-901(+)